MQETPQLPTDLISANTTFGFQLLRTLSQEQAGRNSIISPTSVALALMMTINAAGGATTRVIAQVLGVQNLSQAELHASNRALLALLTSTDPGVRLAIANAIFTRLGYPPSDEYVALLRQVYRAEARELDFTDPGTVKVINDWVGDRTNGKIKEILRPPIRDSVIQYVINAVYFKGRWSVPFDEQRTRTQPFTLLDGRTKLHPLMFEEASFRYAEGPGWQAIALPYGDKRFSMYVFLPAPGASPAELARQLSAERWAGWLSRFRQQKMLVGLPKFRIEYQASLLQALTTLGMGLAFDPSRADFSAAYPGGADSVSISDVLHKTFIEVNEEGTEAAAVTAVELSITAVFETPALIVDRPFFFAISDDVSGSVLFSGLIFDPAPSS